MHISCLHFLVLDINFLKNFRKYTNFLGETMNKHSHLYFKGNIHILQLVMLQCIVIESEIPNFALEAHILKSKHNFDSAGLQRVAEWMTYARARQGWQNYNMRSQDACITFLLVMAMVLVTTRGWICFYQPQNCLSQKMKRSVEHLSNWHLFHPSEVHGHHTQTSEQGEVIMLNVSYSNVWDTFDQVEGISYELPAVSHKSVKSTLLSQRIIIQLHAFHV